jgi:glycosyltransferase involved in cell wall biosynthesis
VINSNGFHNILFVLYGDFRTNSAVHAHSLTRELAVLGFDCAIAVPHGTETAMQFPSACFTPVLFEELLSGRFRFKDGRGPDIVHAWTPRESVRTFCNAIRVHYNFRQFIHMEDNEWHLLARLNARKWNEIEKMTVEQLDGFVPSSLFHPVRGAAFMKDSQGVTMIMDRLSEIVPSPVPTCVLWPSAQKELFFERPLPKLDGRELGIPEGNTVIVYSGNVHPANASEMRSLYLAVAILNREGFPVTLVRTGEDYCPYRGPDDHWARENAIELGLVPRAFIPSIMALADLFVQPGKPDVFNDYRFPCKLPEFLSIGRPVILPASNVALHMKHGVHAWILDDANGINIAMAVRRIMGDSDLYRTLAAGALQFFREQLDWEVTARKLVDFYAQTGEPVGMVQAAG